MYDLLKIIDDPENLRCLDRKQLQLLSKELRAYILESVSRTGGHLSSNLGTVELTIALHYVFDTPNDRIVWDVGHQTYSHKILTGRRDKMSTLRQLDGISGFPHRSESIFDTFGTAHSSTSISAAYGMSVSSRLNGSNRFSIAVIGDGAMTAGIAFEGMNNAGIDEKSKLLIILNDNEMSISPTVGGLNRYLSQLTSSRFYSSARANPKYVSRVAPLDLQDCVQDKEHKKRTIFEKFGFNYIGPTDGHDLNSLINILKNIKGLVGPQFLHVITKKGYSYKLAEADPILYHGPGKFNLDEGIKLSITKTKTYTQVFSEWICDEAEADTRIIAITPAMREGSGLVEFEKRFPNRYYDVGIAEQHAVTFAGGLAVEGMKPIVAIYSTFLQRAYDQLIHDIALQNLPVVFAIDRSGLVGQDGATHAGGYDLAFLRCIPNMMIMTASDENECRQMLHTALQQPNPTAVRYPRGIGTGVLPVKKLTQIEIGKGEVRRRSSQSEGKRIAIFAFGTMVTPSLEVADKLNMTVANMRFVKPLDILLIQELAMTHDFIVTIEEGCIMGGAGSACIEALMKIGIVRPVLQLGLPDRFIFQGNQKNLLSLCGLDTKGIMKSICTRFLKI
ncbi:MAG: 1-deoxy-D-xylulose-5-phosphate synthase [Burkholderia sp.]|nr:1-deoxy-D-xylulose-5-phosphate synthase [Burkholderia sp.]